VFSFPFSLLPFLFFFFFFFSSLFSSLHGSSDTRRQNTTIGKVSQGQAQGPFPSPLPFSLPPPPHSSGRYGSTGSKRWKRAMAVASIEACLPPSLSLQIGLARTTEHMAVIFRRGPVGLGERFCSPFFPLSFLFFFLFCCCENPRLSSGT